MQRNLYREWQDALNAPGFDIVKLEEIHSLWQARLKREAQWKQVWDQCAAEHSAECASIAQQVRTELEPLSRSDIVERGRERFGWGTGNMKAMTKLALIDWFVQDSQRDVRDTTERAQEEWKIRKAETA